MQIILSPAKKMTVDTDSFSIDALPQFLPRTRQLLAALRALPGQELQTLWQCNDALAALNRERLRTMELERQLTPALLAYVGIQYQSMAPGVFTGEQYDYLRAHLRILSGFYGLLRPFDGVRPYRLEMQAKLAVGGCPDLYAFWGADLAMALAGETDLIVNLASKEYSRAVQPHLPAGVRFLTCTFGERQRGKIIEKATPCKIARGRMVRWMAESRVTLPEQLKAFDERGYRFSVEDSTDQNFVFIK